MKVTRQEMKEGLLEIDVEVDVGEVEEAYDKAFQKVAQEIVVPGFRKGKAPRRLVEARTKKDLLEKEVKAMLLPEVYDWTIKELDLVVLETQSIDGQISSGEAATVTMQVEVLPQLELGPYVNLEIPMKRLEVTEAEVEEEIAAFRRKYATLKRVDRDVVEKGDYIVLDYEAFLDGESFPDSTQKDIAIEIGAGNFLQDFEEGCIGLRVGEEGEVSVTYPENLANEDLAGRTLYFKVLVKEIKSVILPPLDDDWVRSLYLLDVKTVSDLWEYFRREREAAGKQQQEAQYERLLLNEITKNSTIEIPEQLLEQETDLFVESAFKDNKKTGEGPKTQEKKEQLKESFRPQAEARIKDRLVLDAVAKKEGFQVETDELDQKISQLAKQHKMEKNLYKRKIFKEKRLDEIKQTIINEKTILFLHENNFAIYPDQEEQENQTPDV